MRWPGIWSRQHAPELLDEDIHAEHIRVTCRAQLRYDGTDTTMPVEFTEPDVMTEEFEASHRATYSFLMDRPIIVEALSVEAVGLTQQPDLSDLGEAAVTAEPDNTAPLYTAQAWRDVPLHRRENLRPGHSVTGPAIITEANATTLVDTGWRAAVTPTGHLLVERVAARKEADVSTEADPVLLEVFNNLFMSIAEQMGARLESTAQSVNIKERLDFSCALFNPDGDLIANAPHIPVHLGSMGTAVKEVIRRRAGTMKPGDAYAVNDPYNGGTHLPDVTVVTPAFEDRDRMRVPGCGDSVLRRFPRTPCRDRRPYSRVHAGDQP